MKQRLISEGIWAEIADLAQKARVRRMAIAYVTDTAGIALSKGDTLITDASNSAIASGSTDAKVLQRAIAAGADVYSVPGLHAKVLRLDSTVIVGSCNLSKRSQSELVEAGVISDDAKLVAQVDAFIDALQASGVRLTRDEVGRLLKIPVTQRVQGSSRTRAVAAADNAVWILGLPEMEVDADEDAVADQMAQVKREEGRAVEVDEFYWPKTHRFAKKARVGDLVISVYRPSYSNRRRDTIRIYRPVWIKRIIPAGKNHDVGFVTTVPKSVAQETLEWATFHKMASIAGVVVKPDCEIRLTERQWRILSAQWDRDSGS